MEVRFAALKRYMKLAATAELTSETTPHIVVPMNGPLGQQHAHNAGAILCLYPDGDYGYLKASAVTLTEEEAISWFLGLEFDPRAVEEHEHYRTGIVKAGATVYSCTEEESLRLWQAEDMANCEGGSLPTIMVTFTKDSTYEWLCCFVFLRSSSLQEVFSWYRELLRAAPGLG